MLIDSKIKTRAQSIRAYHQLNAVQCDYMDVLFMLRNCIKQTIDGFSSAEIADSIGSIVHRLETEIEYLRFPVLLSLSSLERVAVVVPV